MVCNNPRLRLMKALRLHHMINVCGALVFLYEFPLLGILTKVEASIVQLVRLEPNHFCAALIGKVCPGLEQII